MLAGETGGRRGRQGQDEEGMEMIEADHYIESGPDEQFLIRSEVGFAVVNVGEVARWIEAAQYDQEDRFDQVWHLPPGGEPTPCVLRHRHIDDSRDSEGFKDYAYFEVDAIPEPAGEPVATGAYRTDLRS